jgi:hypothetical protein
LTTSSSPTSRSKASCTGHSKSWSKGSRSSLPRGAFLAGSAARRRRPVG